MSLDLDFYKKTLGNDSKHSALIQSKIDRANRVSEGLANTKISEEERADLKKQKSEIMSTIQYKNIDFSDDKQGLFLKPYGSEYLEIDDVSATDAVLFAAQLGATDTVRGVQQITGLGAEEVEKQQQKLRRLMNHPEYGGRVMTAYMGGIVADPVGWALPFVKVYKAATIGQKMKKLAAAGALSGTVAGATGYVDEEMPSLIYEGENMSRAEQTAIGTISGTVLAPAIGGAVNSYKYFRGKPDYLPLREKVTPEPVSSRVIKSDPSAAAAKTDDEISAANLNVDAPKKASIVEPSVDGKASKLKVKPSPDGSVKLEKPDAKISKATEISEFNKALLREDDSYLWRLTYQNPTAMGGGLFGGVIGWNNVDENKSVGDKLFGFALGAVAGAGTGYGIPRIPLTTKAKDAWQSFGFTKPKNVGNIFGDLFVDRYRLRNYPEMKQFLDDLTIDQNLYLGKFKGLVERVDKLTGAERKTLYRMLNGEEDDIASLAGLRIEAREAIKDIGQYAVEVGLLKRETFLQNMNTYLHRTYAVKIDEAVAKMSPEKATAFRNKINKSFAGVRVIGDSIKPRGLFKSVSLQDYVDDFSKQKASTHLKKISKNAGLDEIAKINGVDLKITDKDLSHKGWEFFDDIVKASKAGKKFKSLGPDAYVKVTKRADPVIDKDGNFVRLGKVLDAEKLVFTDKVNIRWQLTKTQREALGEIEDASFALREMSKILSKDTTTLNFFNRTARQYGKSKDQLIKEGFDENQIDELFDLVPETPVLPENLKGVKIDPRDVTDLKSYGELAGKYIPREIATEIADIDNISSYLRVGITDRAAQAGKDYGFIGSFYRRYRQANTFWKKTKTAYNPAVHVNNVVSNVALYDFSGSAYKHLSPARKSLFKHIQGKKDNLYDLARTVGLFEKDFLSSEMRELQKLWKDAYVKGYVKSTDNVLEILDGSMKNAEVISKELAELTKLQKAGKIATKPLRMLETLYQQEDYFFRLGVFRDRIEKALNGQLGVQKRFGRLGITEFDRAQLQKILDGEAIDLTQKNMKNVKDIVQHAKNEGVKWFINYDIQAPGINFLRATATPFLAYSYRVVPLLAEAATSRPTKMMKWGAIAYGLDIAGSNFAYDVKTNEFGALEDFTLESDAAKAERLLFTEQNRGNLFGFPGFPNRMLKTPIAIDGVPQYLDVTRWTPGGDVFDINQGTSKIPYLPAPLQPSFGAAGSLAFGFAGFDPFRMRPTPGVGIDSWGDFTTGIKSTLIDFMPNIVVLGWAGHGSYSYQKVKKALARQGKENIFQDREEGAAEASPFEDDIGVMQAVLHTLGIKLMPAKYETLEARKRMELVSKIDALITSINDKGRKWQKGLFTEEQFQEMREDAIKKRDEIQEEYGDLFERSSALWAISEDPLENPIWPYETERERQERQSMLWDEIEKDPKLFAQSPDAPPPPYKLIKEYSEKYGVDNKAVEGIVVAESNFDPRVLVNKKVSDRAYGLMKIRKSELDDVNDYYDLDFSEKDLQDPRINLEVGVAYFAMQRDKYKAKDLDAMIQGYNAGPNKKSPVYLKKVKDDMERPIV